MKPNSCLAFSINDCGFFHSVILHWMSKIYGLGFEAKWFPWVKQKVFASSLCWFFNPHLQVRHSKSFVHIIFMNWQVAYMESQLKHPDWDMLLYMGCLNAIPTKTSRLLFVDAHDWHLGRDMLQDVVVQFTPSFMLDTQRVYSLFSHQAVH